MVVKHLKFALLFFIFVFAAKIRAQERTEEQRIKVSMRMIGHRVLLSLADSTSRVLPIEKDGNRYRIPFATEFQFNPEELAATVDSVVEETGVANRYIVEVEDCGTNEVVYSYIIGNTPVSSMVPCRTRDQPKACYNLFITILKPKTVEATLPPVDVIPSETIWWNAPIKMLPVLFILIGVSVFIWKKRRTSVINSDTVAIGHFNFDKRKMQLSNKGETITLTSKECSLLHLLHDSANSTVERDIILKMVWDDEGDYVGRTLDVFISKLRKKLEADPNVKIMNIRGIGYKLIVDN